MKEGRQCLIFGAELTNFKLTSHPVEWVCCYIEIIGMVLKIFLAFPAAAKWQKIQAILRAGDWRVVAEGIRYQQFPKLFT